MVRELKFRDAKIIIHTPDADSLGDNNTWKRLIIFDNKKKNAKKVK